MRAEPLTYMKKASSSAIVEKKFDLNETTPKMPRQTVPRSIRRTGRQKAKPSNGGYAHGNGESGLDASQVLHALTALKKGDFSVRLPMEWTGLAGKVADTFNDLADTLEHSTENLNEISRVVGKEGKLGERLPASEMGGGWKERVESVNTLITCLVHPISETARVIGAVATGDLSQTMAVEIEGRRVQGEFLRTAKTVNTMVNQLGAFASEVTRVAREVGTEGKLGGQAKVKGVAGTWKDLTDNVNLMASNLTSQVRNIATVTTAVANGDLTKKITVDVRGEFLELKDTINTMVDQLTFVCIGSDACGARSRYRG